MEKKPVNIRLPVDLYHRFKVRAAVLNTSISDLMAKAMERILSDPVETDEAAE